MADNDQSKIRYDDFISKVQPDPAKPEATIMLSGFLGHGPDGLVRIFPEPTLGTWYDVPEADIVHSLPIADSKLGGSHVWVRASAEIKPGSSAPAPAPAAAPQAMAAGMLPTPATHCFVCPDPQQAAAALLPTPQTHCFICPPLTQDCTLATVCTQPVQCPPQQSLHCLTMPVVCDTRPTVNCTPATVCTHPGQCPPQTGLHCPTMPVVCDTRPTVNCTPATVCTQPVQCPPQTGLHCPTMPVVCDTRVAQNVGTTAFSAMIVCGAQPTTTVQHTHLFICPPQQTLATVCTQIGCPTHPAACLPTQPVVCGILPPSFGCTQQGCGQGAPQAGPAQEGVQAMAAGAQVPSVHICPTPSAVGQCGPVHPSLATICTLPPGCPPQTVHNSQCICPTPSAVGQCGPHPSLATVCTLPVVCQAHPSLAMICTLPPACPVGGQTLGMWATPVTTATLAQNGVFTPFGR